MPKQKTTTRTSFTSNCKTAALNDLLSHIIMLTYHKRFRNISIDRIETTCEK
jgi:hypothetical protein